MRSGIYKIVNQVNGKEYIGSSKDVNKRFTQHKSHLEKNDHHNIHLQRAWNIYGKDKFVFEKIEDVSPSQLLEREQYHLDKVKDAYNMRPPSEMPAPNVKKIEPTKVKSFLNPTWVEVGGNNSRPADLYGAIPSPTVATLLSMNSDSIYSCTHWVANAIAKSELKVLVKTHPGQKSPKCYTKSFRLPSRLKFLGEKVDVREVLEHPLVELLDNPNPELSKYDFLYYIDSQLSLAGNAYVHIVRENYDLNKNGQPVRNEGLPVGLWPLMTQYVETLKDKGRVSGYKYNLADEPIIYSRDDVIHIRMISHENPYAEGYGPVRAVFERILLAKNELAYLNSLFRNQARPDSIITLKGGATADQCERMQKELTQRFRQGGIGGPYVVDGEDLEIQNLSWSPKDVLGVELYKWTKLQIINAFGLNAAIFDTESSNRATAIAARIQSQEQAIEPRLRLIEERLNNRLIPEFDERLLVAFESPVEADEEMVLKKLQAYGSSPILTVNEARKMMDLGLTAVADGDKLMAPAPPKEEKPKGEEKPEVKE